MNNPNTHLKNASQHLMPLVKFIHPQNSYKEEELEYSHQILVFQGHCKISLQVRHLVKKNCQVSK
jgi:hypothetical protein